MQSNRYTIVVAAGSGRRMGKVLPKQFLVVAGKPILMHTLNRLHTFDRSMNLLLVLHPDYFAYWQEQLEAFAFDVPHTVVGGGEERFHSVKCALDTITSEHAVVGIHDGVRPFVDVNTLMRCFEMAEKHGSAVPVIAVNDSVREVQGEVNRATERSNLRIVQTPQCFQLAVLRKAFTQPYSPSFTDDASVVESAGYSILLVEGNRENIKVTTPEDLRWAEWTLSV